MRECKLRDEARIRCALSGLHLLDGDSDEAELRGEIIRQFAGVVQARNAGDEQQIADPRGVGKRRGFDVRRWREVGDHGGFLIGTATCGLHEAKRDAGPYVGD